MDSRTHRDDDLDSPRLLAFCPWKGLDAYAPDDSALFVGRERAVRQLRSAVETSTLAGVVGASGSGKSSLLLAGLGRYSSVTVLTRPGTTPMLHLREAMSRVPVLEADADCPVLAADQLEEVFTLCEDESERAAYLDELCDIAESGRARVVVALRSDHYGSCAPYRRFADALSQSHVLLGAPTEEELRRIISVPAAAAGLTIERGLDDEIIDDVLGESGALPLLSHALTQTWLRRTHDNLTRRAYREVGGVRGAIARTAEELWLSLPPARQQATRAILVRLAAPGAINLDSSRRVLMTELTASGDADAEVALRGLVDARLVTVDSGTAEIAHEAVFREWPRLHSWVQESRDAFRVLGQLRAGAEAWSEQHDDSGLYRGARLQTVLEVIGEFGGSGSAALSLDPTSQLFLDASVAAAKRQETERATQVARERRANRRLRVLLTSAIALLVMSVTAGTFAVRQRDRANAERRTADARRLAAVAADVRSDRLDLAVLLSMEALRLHDDLDTRGALFASLNAQPGLLRYLYVDDAIVDIAVDPSGHLAAFPGNEGDLDIWDIGHGEPVRLRSIHLGLLSKHNSPQRIRFVDKSRILVGDSEGGVYIVDAATGGSLVESLDRSDGAVTAVALSPDSNVIASSGDDALVHLTDARTGLTIRPPLTGHEDAVQFVEFRADGRVLASGSADGSVRFWDTANWKPIGEPMSFDGGLWALKWLPEMNTFVVASDSSVQFFDATSRQPISAQILAHDGATYRLELIEGGQTLVTSGEDGYIRFWDTATFRPNRPALRAHAAGARIAIAENANRMVSAGDDGTIAVWDLRGATPVARPIATKSEGRTQVATAADGRLFTADRAGFVRLWDAQGMGLGEGMQLSSAPIVGLSLSRSGSRAAVARSDNKAQVFELPSGRPVTPLLDLSSRGATIALSPGGDSLVLSHADQDCDSCFAQYDLSKTPVTARLLRPRPELSVAIAAAFDPTGEQFTTGSRNGWVDGWSTKTGAHLWSAGFPRGVRSLAYSPDGTRLAVGANSGLLIVLDAKTGKRLQQLRGHRGPIVGVAFSPDGRLLASQSSQDHTLRIWRLDLGLTVGRPAWLGFDGIASVGWTDAGRKVAAPHSLTGVMLFDIDPKRMSAAACGLARRNFSREEWRQYFGTKPYRSTCSAYPAGS